MNKKTMFLVMMVSMIGGFVGGSLFSMLPGVNANPDLGDIPDVQWWAGINQYGFILNTPLTELTSFRMIQIFPEYLSSYEYIEEGTRTKFWVINETVWRELQDDISMVDYLDSIVDVNNVMYGSSNIFPDLKAVPYCMRDKNNSIGTVYGFYIENGIINITASDPRCDFS